MRNAQGGFMPERGGTDQMFDIQQVIDTCSGMNKKL